MTTRQTPPTFNRTNKFTAGFQAIIDAYGVANYREVNPALYTIITFPFLFSVMFGDCGHGLIMALFAYWLIRNERALQNNKSGGEIFGTMFAGRYIIFLMGLFSIYSGFIYNDAFSKSLNIFGSAWVVLPDKYEYRISSIEAMGTSGTVMFNPNDTAREVPYYLGIDPIWQLASNKLTFTNSLKMKLSIVFGVTHMLFGVVLSAFNHIHFKETYSIWMEFIPQMLFINCIFGYLVILIFYKWIAFSIKSPTLPSLLLGLIGMFLNFGSPIAEADLLYTGQHLVQQMLVVIAVIAVPWMLLSKPFYLRYLNKQKNREGFQRLGEVPSASAVSTGINSDTEGEEEVVHNETTAHKEEDDEAEFDFSEVFINQAIHTIEYCLGCISNTASYLRLWALSLAHAQLSEVLWSMVFHIALGMKGKLGSVAIFVIFAAWAVLTVAILLVMEGLSAFLHTLRLHWVEFNNKFYHGAGNKFAPFSFKIILSEAEG